MSFNENNHIYSHHMGNTAASSSTTMIVPSLSQPSEKDDDDEEEAKELNEKHPQSYSHSDIKQKQPYDYNDLQQPLECHAKGLYDSHANIETPTSIPIPFSSNDSTYYPPRSVVSAPLPRFESTPSATSLDSYSSSATASPKKRAKRWIMAALMIIVGLLIALTFILIGLGKAFSHHHESQTPAVTVTNTLNSSSIRPATVNAVVPISAMHPFTTTVLVVPTTVTAIFSSPTL
ncbi:hypothetical protein BC941DRAFT_469557 [Chlamydoabsidia padenii]|nr:hypothetical protein BC941DRAFT_469557 [Chlamydoabsidia padenii]